MSIDSPIPLPPPRPEPSTVPSGFVSPKDKQAAGLITKDQLLSGQNIDSIAVQANAQLQKDLNTIIDLLQSNQPTLPPGDPNAFSNLSKATKGNAVRMAAAALDPGAKNNWFEPNAAVAFIMAFQSFTKALSKIALLQGTEIGPKQQEQMMSLAKDIASNIMAAAKEESKMHTASAIASGISGAVSIVGAAGTTVAAVKMAKQPGGWDKIKIVSDAVTQATGGISSIATMKEKTVHAGSVLEKAVHEAINEMQRTLLNLTNQGLDRSNKIQSDVEEMIKQFFQTLSELLRQAAETRKLGKN